MKINKLKGKVDDKRVVIVEMDEEELAVMDMALKKEHTFVNRSWEKSDPSTPEEVMYWAGRKDAVSQLRKDITNINKRLK